MHIKEITSKLRLKNFIVLTIAGLINAFAIALFLAPANLYDGGFSGLSMLLASVTPDYLPITVFLLVLNVPVIAYGFKRQGALFTIYSLYTVLIYSVGVWIFGNVIPFDFSLGSPLAEGDLLLSAVFGGLISGIGSGLTIRYGGAIDGVEVLAVTFAKRIGITVGTFVMIFNIIVYVIAGLVLKSWTLPLYSILAYAVGLKTVDFIVEGLNHVKSAVIITSKSDEVCAALSEEFNRGITVMDAKGYYSDEDKAMIYFVVNRYQIEKMKTLVKSIDKNAFISISEVTDGFGSNMKPIKDRPIKKKSNDSTTNDSDESAVLAGRLPDDGSTLDETKINDEGNDSTCASKTNVDELDINKSIDW